MSLSIKDFCLRISKEIGIPIRMVWTSVLQDATDGDEVLIADGMMGGSEISFKEPVQFYGMRRRYSEMSEDEKVVTTKLSMKISSGPVIFVGTVL